MSYNFRKIKRYIDSHEFISFDAFDTLIKRNINEPSDLFELVERLYNKRYGKKLSNFKNFRIQAEKEAMEGGKEPTIQDIYNRINIIDKDNLQKIEIELELLICQQNIDFYPIYSYTKQKNKKIIITSDMYLPKEVIEKILTNAGVEYDALFLSSEIGASKRNGKIYLYILRKLGIDANQLLHIGDSKRRDFLIPRIYGIKSLLIPTKIRKLTYWHTYKPKTLDENIVLSYLNNNLKKEKNIYYQVGYEVLGVILWGYAIWLGNEIKKRGIRKVYFLAREGALLKRIFDIIDNTESESRYLYVSRVSTRPCLLNKIDNVKDVFNICQIRQGASVRDFLENVGLKPENYKSILTKYHVKITDMVWGLEKLPLIFEDIKEDIHKTANRREKTLTAYLTQECLNGRIAVSDIGWHGTMQMTIATWAKQNDIDMDIYGFYIGDFGGKSKSNKQNGFLYRSHSDERFVKGFMGLFEDFFLAVHGTTLEYKKNNKKVVPILDEYEFSKQDDVALRELQEGAMCFVKNINSLKALDLNITGDFARTGIDYLGTKPTESDIENFGNIAYLDTRKLRLIQSDCNFFSYCLNPKKFKKDFLDSTWKIGFLKKIIRIPLPYDKILQNIYAIIKR